MRIQSTQFLYPKTKNSFNNSMNYISHLNLSQDKFIPSFTGEKERDITKNIFSKQRKFDIKAYKNLSIKEKLAIYSTIPKYTKEDAKKTIKLAKFLKRKLDKEYGKDKYIFISIGTSPASIGRAMEFMGVETKYLPISSLRFYQEPNKDIKQNSQGKKAYGEFLKSQGISRESLSNTDKTYLFYDFTATGRTLKCYKKLLRDTFNFPVKCQRVKFKSLNEELKEKAEDSIFIKDEHVENYIYTNMAQQGSYEYAGVPHLEFREIEKIEDAIRNENSDKSKKFNFILITELEKKGLLKNNPLNDTSI